MHDFLRREKTSQRHAWAGLPTYDPSVARFSTWLFTIARNLALNEMGRSGRHREITGETPREAGCDGRQVCDELAARDRREKLQAALRRLPPAERSIIALAYLRELPLAELARMEGCSNEAIKVRLHRAKARLRRNPAPRLSQRPPRPSAPPPAPPLPSAARRQVRSYARAARPG